MLKNPKNLDRELKIWGIVENGLYFENIKKNLKKLMIGFKNASGGKTIQTFRTIYTFGAYCKARIIPSKYILLVYTHYEYIGRQPGRIKKLYTFCLAIVLCKGFL